MFMNTFLKKFAVNATKKTEKFYTPHDVVELIASFIQPFDGTLYDPCCGSGGMFVQSAALIEAKKATSAVSMFTDRKKNLQLIVLQK